MERAGLLKRLLDIFRRLVAEAERHTFDERSDVRRILEPGVSVCCIHPAPALQRAGAGDFGRAPGFRRRPHNGQRSTDEYRALRGSCAGRRRRDCAPAGSVRPDRSSEARRLTTASFSSAPDRRCGHFANAAELDAFELKQKSGEAAAVFRIAHNCTGCADRTRALTKLLREAQARRIDLFERCSAKNPLATRRGISHARDDASTSSASNAAPPHATQSGSVTNSAKTIPTAAASATPTSG